jgi:hypothetical protein
MVRAPGTPRETWNELVFYRYHNESSRSAAMTYARLDVERLRRDQPGTYRSQHVERPGGGTGYAVQRLKGHPKKKRRGDIFFA